MVTIPNLFVKGARLPHWWVICLAKASSGPVGSTSCLASQSSLALWRWLSIISELDVLFYQRWVDFVLHLPIFYLLGFWWRWLSIISELDVLLTTRCQLEWSFQIMLHLGPSDPSGLEKCAKHGDASCFWGENFLSPSCEIIRTTENHLFLSCEMIRTTDQQLLLR